ncbi:MAG: type II toxin-antitoxin system RelB/DinJ family antitoxin, partial [Thermosipho sp. (in: Bacteria)]|nr:type II toxin-antitoxin system RelB/DinJ family antitoxin [Thermosipho sp. (in: thermotogales)]
SDGINMFLAKIVMDKKLPFELELPNKETMEAVKEAKEGKITYNDSADDLVKELRS